MDTKLAKPLKWCDYSRRIRHGPPDTFVFCGGSQSVARVSIPKKSGSSAEPALRRNTFHLNLNKNPAQSVIILKCLDRSCMGRAAERAGLMEGI